MHNILVTAIQNDGVSDALIEIYMTEFLKEDPSSTKLIYIANLLRAHRANLHSRFFDERNLLKPVIGHDHPNTEIRLPADHPERVAKLVTEYTRLTKQLTGDRGYKAPEQRPVTRHFVAICEKLLSSGVITSTQIFSRSIERNAWYSKRAFNQACQLVVEVLEKGDSRHLAMLPDE